MFQYIKARLGIQQDGRSLVDYALILALIAVVVVITLTSLGGGIVQQFGQSSVGR